MPLEMRMWMNNIDYGDIFAFEDYPGVDAHIGCLYTKLSTRDLLDGKMRNEYAICISGSGTGQHLFIDKGRRVKLVKPTNELLKTRDETLKGYEESGGQTQQGIGKDINILMSRFERYSKTLTEWKGEQKKNASKRFT